MPGTRRLILHIGSDKAGSTAIQAALLFWRDKLLEQGIYVPEMEPGSNSPLESLFRSVLRGRPAKMKKALQEAAEYESLLLSWEGLHFLDESSLELFKPFFDDFSMHIIFYVRDQAEALQSGLLQELQESARWVDFNEESRHLHLPESRDYLRTVSRWEKVFDTGKHDVVLYDREELPNSDVVEDFFARIGIVLPGASELRRQFNPSLDIPAARLVNFMESSTQAPGVRMEKSRRRNLVDLILQDQIKSPIENGRYYLPPKDVERIRKHYKNSNSQLVKKYGVSPRLLQGRPLPYISMSAEEQFQLALQRSSDTLFRWAEVPLLPRVRDKKQDHLCRFLQQGWHEPEEWGIWSDGESSRIYCRLEFIIVSLVWDYLEIKLEGRYLSQTKRQTKVILNGKNLGNMDLRKASIKLPKSEIRAPFVIDLELIHNRAMRPEKLFRQNQDQRRLAYGLESLSFRYFID